MKKSTWALVSVITLLIFSNLVTLYFWIDTSVTLMYTQDSWRSAAATARQAAPILRGHAMGKDMDALETEWRKHGVPADSIFRKAEDGETVLVIDNFAYLFDANNTFRRVEFSNSMLNTPRLEETQQ